MTDFGKPELFFDQFSDAYTNLYSPSEHLAVEEVTVLFKGRYTFKK
jgi:hypothetical protein